MEYDEILQELAPCGLNCRKCLAHEDGDIKKTSRELQQQLGSFDKYAERFSRFMPVFANYPAFKELLAHMTEGDCPGCRSGRCKFANCHVTNCYKDKGVDFCFECDAFPCDDTTFDSDLKDRWIKMNRRMKAIGVQAYYEETKDLPRYQ